MALPAGEGGGNVEGIVTEIKGLVSGLLFKVATNTKNANDNLAAIKVRSSMTNKLLGDLVAKAELDFEREADEEILVSDVPDADKNDSGGLDGDNAQVVELLTEIRDATKETSEHTLVLADAERERGCSGFLCP